MWVCIINKESIKSFSLIKNNCIIKISAYGYTCNRKSVKIKGTEIFVFDILSHKNNYIWDIQKWIQNILVISNQNTHENGKFYLQGYLIFFFFFFFPEWCQLYWKNTDVSQHFLQCLTNMQNSIYLVNSVLYAINKDTLPLHKMRWRCSFYGVLAELFYFTGR